MNLDEQWTEFRRRVDTKYPGHDRREAVGASNAPFILENGFRFGLYNIDGVDCDRLLEEHAALVLLTRLVLPPRRVLHLGLAFSGSGLEALKARRTEIAAAGPANKVRVYLHETGIYLRQDRDLDVINPADPGFGAAIRATSAMFADVEREAQLDPVEVSYIGYLSDLVRPAAFERLGPAGATGGSAALNVREMDVSELVRRITALGGEYSGRQIERYHVALNHLDRKHFVLLTGISGTGKTMLAKAYAYSVFDVPSLVLPSAGYYPIPVHPEWTEPANLLGFLDAISGTYRRTAFVDALLDARSNRHRPVFVCLDEMNLAQPEYYFADVLSAMETGEQLRLHDGDEGTVGVPQRVAWPENLYITGTVNVDETTRPFSPKVLDRANVIDMSDVDIARFIGVLRQRQTDLANSLTDDVQRLLQDLHDILRPHSLHFGYRTVVEFARYLAFASARHILENESTDIQIEQKILTKLRGGPEQRAMLEQLRTRLRDKPRSVAVVERMLREVEYGGFQYWS